MESGKKSQIKMQQVNEKQNDLYKTMARKEQSLRKNADEKLNKRRTL